MRKNLLTLLVCAFTLTAFAQIDNEQLSHIKKIRHTTFPLNDDMTEWETRLDDQHITHNFYDIAGNKVLQRTRKYNEAKSTSYISYQYNEQNQLIEEINGSTKYLYTYNTDGKVEKREKYGSSGSLSETIMYEYVDGNLDKEIVYGSSGSVSNTYVYKYENGLLVNREKYNSSEKLAGNIEYVYNDKGQLIEECDTTVSTSNSSLGKTRSAIRYIYEYDEQNRLYSMTYQNANVSSYEITGWNEKDKYIYIYEGTTEKKIREELYKWSSTKEVYEIYETDEYTYSSKYGSEFMPQNVSFTPGSKITSIIMTVNEPSNTTGLAGYQVIADNKLLDTLYTENSFEIADQLRGNHSYRVMAVYDTIPGNVTSMLEYNVEINLPAPDNAVVISQEYSSKWAVTFSFDAPQVPEDVTLTGYRYKVTGGNGGASGTSNITGNKISFSLWSDTKNNENNLCTVELYAVYAEGESDAYTFELDLRDTENQILVKWQNERSERTDGVGAMLGNTHYYYTSDYTGEVLVAQVEYDAENNPTLRHTTVDKTEYIETWNATTMQWEKYIKKEVSKEDGSDWDNWWDCVTTSIYDAEKDEYIAKEVVKKYSFYDASWKIKLDNTATYSINNNEETLEKYVTHYYEPESGYKTLLNDTIFAGDKTTITGLVEYKYGDNNKLISKTSYKYENNEFTATESEEYTYNEENGLIASEYTYQPNGENKTLIEGITYYASKEYGTAKNPSNAAFADGVLSWQAPSNKYMLPEGYRVFVNNIPYTDVYNETQVTIENIPTGNYTFTVMSLYNGSESNYAVSVDGSYVNLATFIPTSVSPDAYDAEQDNKVTVLDEVVITFPTAIASLGEGMQATLNSRFGPVGTAEAAISSDKMSVIITLPDNLENGMYFLDIPQGMIIAEDSTYNPALNYTFVLQIPLTYDLPAPVITPESGSINSLDGLEVFTLTFDRDVYVLESVMGVTGTVYLVEVDSYNRTEAAINVKEDNDYTTWTITLAENVKTIGEYRLIIPQATFGDATASASAWSGAFESGKVNAELTYSYSIANLSVDAIGEDVEIRVLNRNIIAPEKAKVYNIQGYETGKKNLTPGVYMVVYNNNVTKVHVR